MKTTNLIATAFLLYCAALPLACASSTGGEHTGDSGAVDSGAVDSSVSDSAPHLDAAIADAKTPVTACAAGGGTCIMKSALGADGKTCPSIDGAGAFLALNCANADEGCCRLPDRDAGGTIPDGGALNDCTAVGGTCISSSIACSGASSTAACGGIGAHCCLPK